MKILVFVDLHESKASFAELKKKASSVDLILCCGDMTIFEHDLHGMIKKIASLKKPTFLIHGNHEEAPHVKAECKQYENLAFCHKRVYDFQGIGIIGYGGGGFSEEDAGFDKFMEKAKKHLRKKNILLTHAPPYNTAADLVWDEHVGNISYRNALRYFDYAFSGHIHETAGKQEKVGKTLVMNPGPKGKIIIIKEN